MAQSAFPGWTGAGGDVDKAWDQIGLGADYLPGKWRVRGLRVGIDVDTKKAKGADGPSSTDNGVKAEPFELVGWMNERHYQAFQVVLPNINPRRPGRDRQPVPIVHPKPNQYGIHNVRILEIEDDDGPTAAGGYRVTIRVMEWFDRPKATSKKQNTPVQANPAPPAQIVGIDGVMEHFNKRHGARLDKDGQLIAFDGEKFPDPTETENVFNSMFGRPP